ncbi:MAG: 3-oxoacyl-[acyl-carrier-protein] reductase [Bacteroidia bacterium]|nr:3-oxoacyl-[acyl-carrier-protein] reductase [Bacteroidia bacterium]
MQLLSGKSALVTGATRGIGRGIALEFAKNGANVAFTYRSSGEAADSLTREIEALGVKALGIQSDAGSMESTEAVINAMVAAFGAIDIIVNNAGITKDNLLMRMSEEQFNEVIQTNLNSVFNTTKASMRQLLKQRSGSYINISSVVGLTGNAGQANYAASKAGMIGFTKSVAKELASRGIRANVVCPGFIATEMTEAVAEEEVKKWLENVPLKRPGTPKDVADLCVFLGSDLSTYITGQVINVDGGMVM